MSLLEVGPLAETVVENKDSRHAYSDVKLAAIFPEDSSPEIPPMKTCKFSSQQVT